MSLQVSPNSDVNSFLCITAKGFFWHFFVCLLRENPAINEAMLLACSPGEGPDWKRNGWWQFSVCAVGVSFVAYVLWLAKWRSLNLLLIIEFKLKCFKLSFSAVPDLRRIIGGGYPLSCMFFSSVEIYVKNLAEIMALLLHGSDLHLCRVEKRDVLIMVTFFKLVITFIKSDSFHLWWWFAVCFFPKMPKSQVLKLRHWDLLLLLHHLTLCITTFQNVF